MPTTKPRITITLDPRTHEVLSRLSAAGGESMSSLVTQFVEVAVPSMERLVVVLERARTAPQEARAGIAAAVERAERELMPHLIAAAGQSDLCLGELERSLPAADAAAERPRRPRAAVPSEASEGGSTPVPVTRGSGGPRKARKGVHGGTV
jgi:hypothetical protein